MEFITQSNWDGEPNAAQCHQSQRADDMTGVFHGSFFHKAGTPHYSFGFFTEIDGPDTALLGRLQIRGRILE